MQHFGEEKMTAPSEPNGMRSELIQKMELYNFLKIHFEKKAEEKIQPDTPPQKDREIDPYDIK